MIKLIGIKRIIVLAILLGINVAIAIAYFLIFEPMRSETEEKLNGITTEISTLQGKIQNTKQDLIDYKINLPKFKQLKGMGFMSAQDRFQLSRDLNDVRTGAGVAGFSFRVDDIKKIENADATAAQMQLINSHISVDNVSSVLDINFYDFLDKMEINFPAHLRINDFTIERKDPVNADTLRKIAAQQPVSLISAKASFDWLTMIPVPPVDPNNPNAPRGQ
ncbi:MAG: hypothetical protein PW788_05135 [Micavibrio sp.]|nr:hypothetical protein [Micavibrio sp.]